LTRYQRSTIKGERSTAELVKTYGVHPTQITQWNKQLLNSASTLFEGRRTKASTVDVDELNKKIGKLEMGAFFLTSRPGVSGHLN